MGIADLNVYSGGLTGLILSAGPVARAVVVILLFFSVVSWTIILYKWAELSVAESEGMKFLKSKGQRIIQAAYHDVRR